jgi:hypothetical protein
MVENDGTEIAHIDPAAAFRAWSLKKQLRHEPTIGVMTAASISKAQMKLPRFHRASRSVQDVCTRKRTRLIWRGILWKILI